MTVPIARSKTGNHGMSHYKVRIGENFNETPPNQLVKVSSSLLDLLPLVASLSSLSI
jgi:hypothetical protein